MKKDNGIMQELVEMGSPLALLPRTMPYHVPEGYWGELAGILPGHEEEFEKEILPTWSKTMPYHVPESYFHQLTGQLVNAATLNGASGKDIFSVPEGYFDQLPAQILLAAKTSASVANPPAKQYHMFRPGQWAAAAILVLFIGLGAYITFSASPGGPGSENMLAAVPSKEIHDYVQQTYRMDVDKVIDADLNNLQVDDKDIIEYLNETGWDAVEL